MVSFPKTNRIIILAFIWKVEAVLNFLIQWNLTRRVPAQVRNLTCSTSVRPDNCPAHRPAGVRLPGHLELPRITILGQSTSHTERLCYSSQRVMRGYGPPGPWPISRL